MLSSKRPTQYGIQACPGRDLPQCWSCRRLSDAWPRIVPMIQRGTCADWIERVVTPERVEDRL
jgi:hypothetical protein